MNRLVPQEGSAHPGPDATTRTKTNTGISPLPQRTIRPSVAPVEMTFVLGWVKRTGNGKSKDEIRPSVVSLKFVYKSVRRSRGFGLRFCARRRVLGLDCGVG